MTEEGGTESKYILRPPYELKFKPVAVKETIHEVLTEYFAGRKEYDSAEVGLWSAELCDEIKSRLKEAGYERYKLVVQVVIGEQRGAGVKTTSRCLWDNDNDNWASDVFMNENLFCVATAFGCFVY